MLFFWIALGFGYVIVGALTARAVFSYNVRKGAYTDRRIKKYDDFGEPYTVTQKDEVHVWMLWAGIGWPLFIIYLIVHGLVFGILFICTIIGKAIFKIITTKPPVTDKKVEK